MGDLCVLSFVRWIWEIRKRLFALFSEDARNSAHLRRLGANSTVLNTDILLDARVAFAGGRSLGSGLTGRARGVPRCI